MKTPFILLVTAIMMAGCSTTSTSVSNQQNQNTNVPPLELSKSLRDSVLELESKLEKVSKISDCNQFQDPNIKQECITNIAFEKAEEGNPEFCNLITEALASQDCKNLATSQGR